MNQQEHSLPIKIKSSPPSILIWLKLYCVVMLLFQGVQGVVASIASCMVFMPEALLKGDPTFQKNPEQAAAIFVFFGIVFLLISALPMPALFAAIVWPRAKSAWHVGIVAIVAGFFTVFGWVATLPLIIFWVRPDVKAYLAGNSS